MSTPDRPAEPAADPRAASVTASRRAVAKGALWSLPALAVVTAAPALAASACTAFGSQWTIQETNIQNRDVTTDTPTAGGVVFVSDAVPGKQGTTTVSTTIPMVQGRTYRFSFQLQTRYGYSNDLKTKFNTSVSIGLALGSQTATLFSGYTQNGTGTRIEPPVAWSKWGAGAVENASVGTSADFTAQSTGTATFSYTFTLAAPTETNNDDWKIIPTLTCL